MPALVMAAWLAAMIVIVVALSEDVVAVALLVGVTVAAGALAGRWWVLLVPTALAAGTLIYSELTICKDCNDEFGSVWRLLFSMIFATIAALLLGAGVGLRAAIDARRTRTS